MDAAISMSNHMHDPNDSYIESVNWRLENAVERRYEAEAGSPHPPRKPVPLDGDGTLRTFIERRRRGRLIESRRDGGGR